MEKDLTKGNVAATMLQFAGPMILGNLLQQCYNLADTLIVGQFFGPDALAAVGSAYTLMTFLTSILIGLCMGSGSVYSFYFGRREEETMRNRMGISFLFIGAVTVFINLLVMAKVPLILSLLHVPISLMEKMEDYVRIVFLGIFFVFLYNYFAFLLRAVGNSVIPLYFLGIAAIINIILDILFVVPFQWGIKGAAAATVLAQIFSGVGIFIYTWICEPKLRISRKHLSWKKSAVIEVFRFSSASCIQQSVMNFGILMIQGLVNRFGTVVMAAFAAGVKIDSFAYMPAQEFGNAFSIFTSQNFGAKQKERVRQGIKQAVFITAAFCLAVSLIIFFTAPYLLQIFINAQETEMIQIGTDYLRIEGAFYCGIGILFLFYGYFRGTGKPEMSLVLTVISLGTRVFLAYWLSSYPLIGVKGIWAAIPIGWILADIAGFLAYQSAKISSSPY